jgi:membrane fusion protein, multidrug efflux system
MFKAIIVSAILLLAAFDSPAQQSTAQNRNVRNNRTTAGRTSAVEVKRCRIKFVKEATLAAGQSGILKFVAKEEGQIVRADSLVAGLVDDIPSAQLAIAEQEASNHIDILFARKATEVANAELDKAKSANIGTPGTVPDVEILRLKLAAEKSSLQIDLAKHKDKINRLTVKLRAAEQQSHEIRAPFNGYVINVFKHKGEAVRQGDPVLEVVDPTQVRAEAKLPLTDALAVRIGDPVALVLDSPGLRLSEEDRTFHGRVTFVDAGVNFATKTVRVWATVKNRNNLLRSGQEARLRIFPSRR